jgi:tetratricopeptide (TPR) repeat protein
MVHPLQTQSVTYIVQRMESLMGLFYLLSLYCFVRSLDSRHGWPWQIVSAISCILGMATKEVAVTAPLVILWYDRALVASSWRQLLRMRGRFYLALGTIWGFALVLALKHLPSCAPGALVVDRLSPLHYALSQPGVILHYLRLCFWPAGQCLDYAWRVPLTATAIIPHFVAVAVLAISCLWCVFRKPAWGFLGGWFFLILAPTSSILPIRDLAFEHRMYLPLAAVVTGAVMGSYRVLRWMALRLRLRAARRKMLLWTPAALAVIALGFATNRRNEVYHSGLAIWNDVVQKAPHNPRAHYNLASALSRQGRFDEATRHYQAAVRIHPCYAMARNNLGVLLAKVGDYPGAIRHYRTTLLIQPDLAKARMNLAEALAHQQCFEEASEHLHEAVRVEPGLIKYARSRPELKDLLDSPPSQPEA